MLRQAAWVEEQDATPGEVIFLNLPEIGIEGPAEVVSIETVAVEPRLGRLVTGVFRHQSGSILDLQIEGEHQPLGTTKSHPFWSVDREDWVSAQDLEPGELLLNDRNQPVRLVSITEREEPQEVYNLEIDGDHCYRVGEQGLLVHNTSNCNKGSCNKKPSSGHARDFEIKACGGKEAIISGGGVKKCADRVDGGTVYDCKSLTNPRSSPQKGNCPPFIAAKITASYVDELKIYKQILDDPCCGCSAFVIIVEDQCQVSYWEQLMRQVGLNGSVRLFGG